MKMLTAEQIDNALTASGYLDCDIRCVHFVAMIDSNRAKYQVCYFDNSESTLALCDVYINRDPTTGNLTGDF